MRKCLLVAVLFGAVSSAHAADLPALRGGFYDGAPRVVNWQGFYAGVQGGYGSSDENFTGSTSNMIAPLLDHNVLQEMDVANWNLGLGKQSSRSGGFGGFAGYNWQYDDVVMGVEMSYLHADFGGSSTASESLVGEPLSDGNFHAVTASALSEISISDMATFRGRAGYAYGSFLPYVFGGFALGNADITRSVTIQDNYAPTFALAVGACNGVTYPVCVSSGTTQAQHNHLIYGYTGGLGVDVHLTGGLFFRAEWEYARFTDEIDTNVNTVRGGLGYKF